MQTYTLTAMLRSESGKEKCKKIRTKGSVPAVLYGDDAPVKNLVVQEHELATLLRAIRGKFVIIDLEVKDDPSLNAKIMLREVQRDPVKHNLLHADLLRLSEKKPIKLSVPVHLIGSSIGQKNGGILEHISRELEIKAIPSKIPSFIEVDVTNLDINRGIHVSDLPAMEGVEIIDKPDTPIAHVSAPRAEAELTPTPAEGAEVKEPELVEKKKKDEGAEAAEEGKPKEKEKK